MRIFLASRRCSCTFPLSFPTYVALCIGRVTFYSLAMETLYTVRLAIESLFLTSSSAFLLCDDFEIGSFFPLSMFTAISLSHFHSKTGKTFRGLL